MLWAKIPEYVANFPCCIREEREKVIAYGQAGALKAKERVGFLFSGGVGVWPNKLRLAGYCHCARKKGGGTVERSLCRKRGLYIKITKRFLVAEVTFENKYRLYQHSMN